MVRKLSKFDLQAHTLATHEGASAYDYRGSNPLIALTFTMGSALFTDGFYEREQHQVRTFAKLLVAAYKVEPRFVWQYAAWMRDPVAGKGNRIQGSLAPALVDTLVGATEFTEDYVAKCLSHRVDDVTAYLAHFKQLGLGAPTPAARRGMARALVGFDEYQLMKYAAQKDDLRLCDVIFFLREELEALGSAAELVLAVGRYLHAPSRERKNRLDGLPLTAARRELWRQPKSYATQGGFGRDVKDARVTWEQVLGHFGTGLAPRGQVLELLSGPKRKKAQARNRAIWRSLLNVPGLIGDMALLRNLRNMSECGLSIVELHREIKARTFKNIWPHQVYAGFKAAPKLGSAFEAIFQKMVPVLPEGRHLGIGDASGSMSVPVGGAMSSMTAMDVAFCLVGLMSETSGLGASFCDDTMMGYGSESSYLSLAQRTGEGPLAFSMSPKVRRAWGGTQVFGAVMELIAWLKINRHVEPPDCLWFFSDMQFHPAGGARNLPRGLEQQARQFGLGTGAPPLETAIKLYRHLFGHVDVVLWNLAAYAPVPVPSDMEGVLLVSGFDANTFKSVEAWRQGTEIAAPVSVNQEVILDQIRGY